MFTLPLTYKVLGRREREDDEKVTKVEMSKHTCTPVQSDVAVKGRKRRHVALQQQQQQQQQQDEENLVENFLCPISLGLPADPVVGSDGRLYERNEILRWLSTRGTSPVTQAPMAVESLVSCHPVRSAIDALVSSGAVKPDEEALFQIRRGKMAKTRGDAAQASSCFRRASDLGNPEAKYLYAVGLLEEAAPSCTEASQLLRKEFDEVKDFVGHYCTTFCDELIEIRPDGTVLFNGERHPDNTIRRKDDRFFFNQWQLDAEASQPGRLLWLRPMSRNTPEDNSMHRIWWFAYTSANPPNCYEQRSTDAVPNVVITAASVAGTPYSSIPDHDVLASAPSSQTTSATSNVPP